MGVVCSSTPSHRKRQFIAQYCSKRRPPMPRIHFRSPTFKSTSCGQVCFKLIVTMPDQNSVYAGMVEDLKVSAKEFAKYKLAMQESLFLTNEKLLFSLLSSVVIMFLMIFPPDALVGIGFDSVFGVYDNGLLDVAGRCKMVVVHRAFILSSPFIFAFMAFIQHDYAIVFTFKPTRLIHYIALIGIVLLIVAIIYVCFHSWTSYRFLHPIRKLQCYSRNVLTDIDLDFNSSLQYRYSYSGNCVLEVTENWLVYCTFWDIFITKPNAASFEIVGAEDLPPSPRLPQAATQMLTMKVTAPSCEGGGVTIINIPNFALPDIQRVLTGIEIVIHEDVRMKLSVVDRFAKAFAVEVEKNEPYVLESRWELEECLACSQTLANVKLVKRCNSHDEQHEESEDLCRECRCRPMWCVDCLAKVFAAKQRPETMSSWFQMTAPCPTCRAPFCILDVAPVVNPQDNDE